MAASGATTEPKLSAIAYAGAAIHPMAGTNPLAKNRHIRRTLSVRLVIEGV
jgi:hypothetical protein